MLYGGLIKRESRSGGVWIGRLEVPPPPLVGARRRGVARRRWCLLALSMGQQAGKHSPSPVSPTLPALTVSAHALTDPLLSLQTGLVTVSSASQHDEQDPDLLALQRLPHVSPLVKPPDALTAIFSRTRQPELPSLHSAAVQQLCRDYAAYCRDAATPLCEGQKTLAKKMCGLEALCARILYLLALRFNELSGCAATLRDVPQIATKLQETQLLLQRCVEQCGRLEQLLPSEHGAL